MTAEKRDLIAETVWRAEYTRATGKERSIPWSEVAYDDQQKYLYVADVVAAALESDGWQPIATAAADEIERLRNDRDDSDAASNDREVEIERLRGELEGKISQSYAAELARQVGELETENERLRGHVSNSLAVLNACRIMIKNRDQRPDEMKLLDAIKIVIAEIET